MYTIKIYNCGKEPDLFKVFDDNHYRRIAKFQTKQDAIEACRIIRMLRIDTAFEGTEVVEI